MRGQFCLIIIGSEDLKKVIVIFTITQPTFFEAEETHAGSEHQI